MADNLVTYPASGGATLASDEIGNVHYPRSKITLGADGSNDGDVSAANPMPTYLVGGELTARMKAFQPQAGWRIWLDTANASHIYVLEALASKVATDTGFQGIRVPKDADGNPLGKVQVNTSATLSFSTRTTDGGWS